VCWAASRATNVGMGMLDYCRGGIFQVHVVSDSEHMHDLYTCTAAVLLYNSVIQQVQVLDACGTEKKHQ
jgi:hypothetical protein